jgi:putative transposase
MPPIRKINGLSYKRALSILNEHFTLQCAKNSQYSSQQLIKSLVYLTVENKYAESGLQNLACTQKAPSADTLLRRLKNLKWKDAYSMLVEANDNLLSKLKHKGIFKAPVLCAADLSDDCYYGEFNNKICQGKFDRGTTQFYRHASLHVVEAGKRATIMTMMVTPFDEHASILEKLILAARARGVRISILLVDRGFNGADVVNKLRELRQMFLMPAQKHKNVKKAIEEFDKGLLSAVIDYTVKGDLGKRALCRLFIFKRKDALPTEPVADRYFAFFTSLPVERVVLTYDLLPVEYRKRWGIETGFRMQDNVQAKTTSKSYTVRVVYIMLSTFLYNIWVLANLVFARRLGVELKKPRIKLPQLSHYFSMQIEQRKRPP